MKVEGPKMLRALFNWMLVIGLILLGGRLVTLICRYFDIPFTTFLKIMHWYP